MSAIRQMADMAGWSVTDTAHVICERCGVTKLRAERLARGWTLNDVAARIRAQMIGNGEAAPQLGHHRVSRWETGKEAPSARYLTELCQLYRTRPDLLGFGVDFSAHSRHNDDVSQQEGNAYVDTPTNGRPKRREVLHGMLATTATLLTAGVLQATEETRRLMTDTLRSSSANLSSVEWWEAQAGYFGGAYRNVPPVPLLGSILLDFDDLQRVLSRRQAIEIQQRLTAVAARLAGLIGILCIDLDLPRQARAWFHTGQIAAEETGDRGLRAWLRTREALASLYYGGLDDAAALARSARQLAGATVCTAAAMAPAVEARALVRIGRDQDALAAIKHAGKAFARLPEECRSGGAFGFTERKLFFYEGNVLARARNSSARAIEVQDRALELYPVHDVVDRSHIQLDRAISLVRRGEIDVASTSASKVLLDLSASDGIGAVLAEAKELYATIPHRYHRAEAVRELRDVMDHHRATRT